MNNKINIKLPNNILTLICMYLPIKKIIELQKLNHIFYGEIIPRVFLQLNQSIKIYNLDSKILFDLNIIKKVYK